MSYSRRCLVHTYSGNCSFGCFRNIRSLLHPSWIQLTKTSSSLFDIFCQIWLFSWIRLIMNKSLNTDSSPLEQTQGILVVSIRVGSATRRHPYRRPPAPGRGATCSSTFTPSSSFLTTSLCCSINFAISSLGAFSIFTLRIIVFSRGKILTHSF